MRKSTFAIVSIVQFGWLVVVSARGGSEPGSEPSGLHNVELEVTLQGYLAHKKTHPHRDPTHRPTLGPYRRTMSRVLGGG